MKGENIRPDRCWHFHSSGTLLFISFALNTKKERKEITPTLSTCYSTGAFVFGNKQKGDETLMGRLVFFFFFLFLYILHTLYVIISLLLLLFRVSAGRATSNSVSSSITARPSGGLVCCIKKDIFSIFLFFFFFLSLLFGAFFLFVHYKRSPFFEDIFYFKSKKGIWR